MSSNPCYSGLWRQIAEGMVRGVVYRPRYRVLLAARLECRLAAGSRPRNGDERRSLALWAVRQPTSHWGLCLVFFVKYDGGGGDACSSHIVTNQHPAFYRPSCRPTNGDRAPKQKYYIPRTCLSQALSMPSLTTKGSRLPWEKFAKPLVSPMTPVPTLYHNDKIDMQKSRNVKKHSM